MLQGFNLTKCDLLPPDLDSISLKLTRFMCISVLTQVLPDIGVGGWKGGLGWNINICLKFAHWGDTSSPSIDSPWVIHR